MSARKTGSLDRQQVRKKRASIALKKKLANPRGELAEALIPMRHREHIQRRSL